MDDKLAVLTQLGFTDYRPLQEEAIDALCENRDVLLAAPTGGGKSLVYQSAGLIRRGVAVVISPLLSLMSQQVNELNKKGINARFLNSTLNPGEQDDLVWSLRHCHIDLLYLSPEKLVQASVLGVLQSVEISLFAIDEAHCITQWGGDFRPEYSQLGKLRELFPDTPIIALTGSVDKKTADQIKSSLSLDNCLVLRNSFDRSNIHIRIAQKRKAKQQILYFIKNEVPGETGIIYCRSRKKVDELTAWFNDLGIPSFGYHAAMTNDEKQKNHTDFIGTYGSLMFATTAYGMGIDIPHIRFVIHVDLPNSPEAFLQEIGRAGRDGRPAKSLLLYGLQDMLQAKKLASNSGASSNESLQKLFEILETRGCRRVNMLAYFDETVEVCNNCDRCNSVTSEQNVTTACQKILSLIYHTKGLHPFSVLIQTLIGKRSKAVTSLRAELSPLFGKGKELNEAQWKAIVRYLLALEYIELGEGHAFTVHLTEKSRVLLQGKEQALIASEYYYPIIDDGQFSEENIKLHQITAWRNENKVAQVNDSQLRLICLHQPKTIASLSRLTGLSKEVVSTFSTDILNLLHEPSEKRNT
ncbi:ATP-dependent DNA helicase [Marinomonas sp. C2222]|uniref:ATP-dependent DNA helicase RecQ n=1 Tax=Marinomonas sargassi TaxID=2984494 RepID=A0ABT2YSB9_9GAMM|nr:ATP-dependent DNA helicase RecQ [Marinomonas sargassi]MCV2402788.1 ATP-dependent DNA helicase [Marinomonas sargassi]